jgi:uncharacterized protein (DUF488 family)
MKENENTGQQNRIWTIGHSTHSEELFIQLLHAYGISLLADVRRFPNSARHPQFNQEHLKSKLNELNIRYVHFPDLGGRRTPKKDSRNIAWRVAAFRGYADYMQSDDFINAMDRLKNMATENNTAYMCAEAPWWRCHRALISDYLKAAGWKVIHIMSLTKSEEHPYTKPAAIVQGQLDYSGNSLQFGA